MSAPRYAIYFTPDPETPLARFGASVIGYDPDCARDVPQLALDHVASSEMVAATQNPRRYGFHATLVAPFYLNGASEQSLVSALDAFCAQMSPAALGRLVVTRVDDFIALTPSESVPAVDALAAACVAFFDRYRAPLSAFDLARRSAEDLSARERQNLERWGYPYVMDEFRFHMSLTGRLAPDDRQRFQRALTDAFRPLADVPHRIESLSVLRQSAPEQRFSVLARRALRRP
ncbi:DUF1045 domain-containing protein [Pseudorhodoplanes sp.]|uniref:DUF1045 domain-containing protein n=1 Tax=Pseudorhodoplanes sp. TaxID=1934341 RepID=UPI0039191BCD